MTVITELESAQTTIAKALAQLKTPIPLPPASAPISTLKGVCAGYWGSQELEDLKSLAPQIVRLGQPSITSPWYNYKIIYLQEGDTNGQYNANGVIAINVSAMVAHLTTVVEDNPLLYALEILNEPGGSWFWGANADSAANQAAYAKLVRAIWEARKTWTFKPLLLASCDGGHRNLGWLEGMLRADPKILECFDYGTVHAYGGISERNKAALGDRTAIGTVHSITKKQVAVTEIGWPTEAQTGDSLQYSEAEQAANIAQYLAWAKSSGMVALTTIYNYREGKPGYGLAHQDSTKKPAWAAFQAA